MKFIYPFLGSPWSEVENDSGESNHNWMHTTSKLDASSKWFLSWEPLRKTAVRQSATEDSLSVQTMMWGKAAIKSLIKTMLLLSWQPLNRGFWREFVFHKPLETKPPCNSWFGCCCWGIRNTGPEQHNTTQRIHNTTQHLINPQDGPPVNS